MCEVHANERQYSYMAISRKNFLLSLSFMLLLAAVFLQYTPTTTFYNKLLGKLELTGFQTSLSLNDYAMKDHLGNEVSWQTYNDKPLYLTTGFTQCPYSCPTTMAFYQKLADRLQDRARFALLTVDPDNDTPAVLKRYLSGINPRFIGLYIEEKHNLIRAIADLKQSVQDIPGAQNIIHSNYIYLLHPTTKGLIIYNKQNLELISQDFTRINQT